MDTKKAFLMYYDYEEQLEDLTDEQLGQLVRIIFKYEKTGEEPQNLGFLMKMAFAFIKGNLNRDRQKYDKRSETSVINGKKGGRPRNKKPNEKPIEKPKKPKKADIDIEIGIDNDIDNDIENVIAVVDSYTYCEEQFGRTLTPIEFQKISNWQTWFSDDVINYAIDKTILNGARGLSYTESIINSWHDKGYKSLKECKSENKKQKESKPEWFEKEIEVEKANEDEIKTLEERINEL